MFDNLKFALFQHKKFLAVFGTRAIYNEKYKLRQRTFDQQLEFLSDVKSEIAAFIEKNSSSLKELSSSPAFSGRRFSGDLNLADVKHPQV